MFCFGNLTFSACAAHSKIGFANVWQSCPSKSPKRYPGVLCQAAMHSYQYVHTCLERLRIEMHENLFSNPKRKPGAQCPAAWHPNFRMCCTCSERLRTRNKRKPIQQPQARTLSLRLCCRASHDRMCCTCLERMQHGIAKQHKHQPRSENPQA